MADKEIVTKAKLDGLANSLSIKLNLNVPLTIDQMKDAVDSYAPLDYETGTYTPAENIANGSVSFSRSHDTAPAIVLLTDTSEIVSDASKVNFIYFDHYKLFGKGFPGATFLLYGLWSCEYVGGSTAGKFKYNSDDEGDSSSDYPRYFVTETGFQTRGVVTRYWLAGRTYEWIAIWV